MLEFLVGSFVMLPWFYFVFPVAVLVICGLYFRKVGTFKLGGRFKGVAVSILAQGLACSLFWFMEVLLLDSVALLAFDGASVKDNYICIFYTFY